MLIKGGAMTQPVQFQVFAASIGRPIVLPGNNRSDYAIRVLPTNLDNDAAGACTSGRENALRAAVLQGDLAQWLTSRAQLDDCYQ